MSKVTYVVCDMEIRARLAEFANRMLASPACASFEEAMALLSTTLLEVEDELSGLPYDPSYPRDDGRMYPPKPDARRNVPGRPDLQRFRSAGHNSYFSDEGAILIVDLQMNTFLDKPDSKGRRIIL